MKNLKLLFAFLLATLFQSCNSAGFGGGLIALPIFTAIVAAYCWYRFLSSLKRNGTPLLIPLVIGIIFTLALIVELIMMAAEK